MAKRHASPSQGGPQGAGRLLMSTLGVCLLLGAAGAGFLAVGELKTAAAGEALRAAAAAAAGGDAEQRAAALKEADAALAWPAASGAREEHAATRALLEEPPDLDAAEAHALAALRRSPTRGNAWAQLSYIRSVRAGGLQGSGLDALAESYRVQPYAPRELRHWRVEFALSRWSELSEEVRADVLREAQGATVGAADWFEESVWTWELADRLPEAPRQALLEAVPPLN